MKLKWQSSAFLHHIVQWVCSGVSKQCVPPSWAWLNSVIKRLKWRRYTPPKQWKKSVTLHTVKVNSKKYWYTWLSGWVCWINSAHRNVRLISCQATFLTWTQLRTIFASGGRTSWTQFWNHQQLPALLYCLKLFPYDQIFGIPWS